MNHTWDSRHDYPTSHGLRWWTWHREVRCEIIFGTVLLCMLSVLAQIDCLSSWGIWLLIFMVQLLIFRKQLVARLAVRHFAWSLILCTYMTIDGHYTDSKWPHALSRIPLIAAVVRLLVAVAEPRVGYNKITWQILELEPSWLVTLCTHYKSGVLYCLRWWSDIRRIGVRSFDTNETVIITILGCTHCLLTAAISTTTRIWRRP